MSIPPQAAALLSKAALGAGTRFAQRIVGHLADSPQASARVAALQAEITELLARASIHPDQAGYYEGEARTVEATLAARLVEEQLLAPGMGSVALGIVVDSIRAGAAAAAPMAAELALSAVARAGA